MALWRSPPRALKSLIGGHQPSTRQTPIASQHPSVRCARPDPGAQVRPRTGRLLRPSPEAKLPRRVEADGDGNWGGGERIRRAPPLPICAASARRASSGQPALLLSVFTWREQCREREEVRAKSLSEKQADQAVIPYFFFFSTADSSALRVILVIILIRNGIIYLWTTLRRTNTGRSDLKGLIFLRRSKRGAVTAARRSI